VSYGLLQNVSESPTLRLDEPGVLGKSPEKLVVAYVIEIKRFVTN